MPPSSPAMKMPGTFDSKLGLTLGMSTPRFSLPNTNVIASTGQAARHAPWPLDIEASVDSAGVAAVPGTGQQLYYSGTLVASALFGRSDVNALNLRYGESPDFTTTMLTWDTRVALGKRLRINPRLRLGVWESVQTGVRRELVTPALRLLWNAARRYRLELEVGRENIVRTSGSAELTSTGKYLNLGYRADF